MKKKKWKKAPKLESTVVMTAQAALWEGRVLSWFSCGASSAVALKLALKKYEGRIIEAVYCDTSADEHPDNQRFARDVAEWLGIEIKSLNHPQFRTVFDVFDKTQFIASPEGASCTGFLKKAVGRAYRSVGDVNIYGFTADRREIERAEKYAMNYPEQNAEDEGRCSRLHEEQSKSTKGKPFKIVLTIAHLCECKPKCGIDAHLKAMCQPCHLSLDREDHARHRRENLMSRRDASRSLLLIGEESK